MRYNPLELLAKLQVNGAAIEEDNTLLKKVSEVRSHRYNQLQSVKDKQEEKRKKDYTPIIDGIGRPLKEIPMDYVKDVINFVGYVVDTSKRSFLIKMKNVLTGEGFVKVKPYVHRWTEIYRKGILAKFYQLEAYLGKDISDIVMITLSTSSRKKTYEDVLSELKTNRKKLLDVLRWKYGTIDYFWVFEYHKSGFSHIHIAYFHNISLSEQVWLKHLWSEKYGSGSYERGLNFKLPDAASDGSSPKGVVGSIRKYFTKYVSKGLSPNPDKAPSEVFLYGKKIPLQMSPAELLFNALLKKTKTRLWGCSRNFSKIMKRPEKEKSEEWECEEVDQYYGLHPEEKEFYPNESEEETKKHFYSVLWTKEGGRFPKEVKTWKHVLTVPTWVGHLDDYVKKGCKFEIVGDFTRILEPAWCPV